MFSIDTLAEPDIRYLISEVEKYSSSGLPLNEIFKLIPLELYGILQFNREQFPNLAQLLPKMPSEKEQISWTGISGKQMLDVTDNYVKSIIAHSEQICNKPVNELIFLDHGCGWGRIARFISKFIHSKNMFGFDPMQSSIDICVRDRVPGKFKLCDAYPDKLPVDDNYRFDLINVFSVFTHLNERYQMKVLEVLRKYISDNGVLVATIRREIFWDSPRFDSIRESMIVEHRKKGFAHLVGGNLGCIDKDNFFGETTISIPYVINKWKNWELVATDISVHQPAQLVMFLKPA